MIVNFHLSFFAFREKKKVQITKLNTPCCDRGNQKTVIQNIVQIFRAIHNKGKEFISYYTFAFKSFLRSLEL